MSHYFLSTDLIRAFEMESEKPGVIFMAYPPISTATSVSKWAKRNNVPFILDIIDPWPEVFETRLKKLGVFSKTLLLPLNKNASKAFISASAITAISRQYIDWSKAYIDTIPTQHFYPAIDYKTVSNQLAQVEKSNNDTFNVIYAGSLGFSYDIPTILEAAEILFKKYDKSIHFVIAGDGPQKGLIEKYQNQYSNLDYLGRIPKEELIVEYKNAQLGLTQHTKGATQSVTYKLFDLLSCGIPVLNSLESEMKDIIVNNKVGLHNSPGNATQLAENIEFYYLNRDELGKARQSAIELTKQEGDSKVVYNKLLNFIISNAKMPSE
jgi:glycosyltransferase involved in cell wall biosynthesis